MLDDDDDMNNDDSLLSVTPPSAKRQKKAPAAKKSSGKALKEIDNESFGMDGVEERPAAGSSTDKYQKVRHISNNGCNWN